MSSPLVTVVIPTIGRFSLAEAVESALAQVGVDLVVSIVADRPHGEPLVGLPESIDPRVSVRYTGGGHGGSLTRQLGTDEATTPWVAYLDDDDRWLPTKLQRQLEAAAKRPEPLNCVVSCQSRSFNVDTGVTTGPIPARVYTGETSLGRWLFHRRELSARRALMPTPTLLVPTALARTAGWRRLPRHQDWDFLLRLDAMEGVEILQVEEVLVEFAVGSPSSVSASANWQTSLDWAQEMRTLMDDQTYADFVMGQPMRYALQARDVQAARTVAQALDRRALPSMRAVALAASGLAGRRALNRAMH